MCMINSRQRAKRIIARHKRLGDLFATPGAEIKKSDWPEMFKIFEEHCKGKILEAFKVPDFRDHPELIKARARKILEEMPAELKEVCDALAKNGLD